MPRPLEDAWRPGGPFRNRRNRVWPGTGGYLETRPL